MTLFPFFFYQRVLESLYLFFLSLCSFNPTFQSIPQNIHPQLKFVACPQTTHYDSLHNLCTIVFMFYPLQSFGYQSRLISSNLCMLSLLGLNFVGCEHDTHSPCTNNYPLQFLTEVLTIPVLQLVSSLQNKILIFHTMISV